MICMIQCSMYKLLDSKTIAVKAPFVCMLLSILFPGDADDAKKLCPL